MMREDKRPKRGRVLVALLSMACAATTFISAPRAMAHDSEAEVKGVLAAIEKADPIGLHDVLSGSNMRTEHQRDAVNRVAEVQGRMVKDGSVSVIVPGESDSVEAHGAISLFRGGKSDVAVRDRVDGVQMLAVLKERGAATSYAFSFPGAYLEPRPDGTVIVREGDSFGEPLALIDAAWAKDATGQPLATHFEVEGETLRQVVKATGLTVFPVVADPRIRMAWYGASLDFTRTETILMAGGAAGVAAVAGLIPDVTVSKAVGAAAGLLAAGASTVAALGRCVSIKYTCLSVPPLNIIYWASPCYK